MLHWQAFYSYNRKKLGGMKQNGCSSARAEAVLPIDCRRVRPNLRTWRASLHSHPIRMETRWGLAPPQRYHSACKGNDRHRPLITFTELHLEQILGQVCTPAMRKQTSLEDVEWVQTDQLHSNRRWEILGEIVVGGGWGAWECVCVGGVVRSGMPKARH